MSERKKAIVHIGEQARGSNLLVPEGDVRNVISKMLAHERLDIILDAPRFPLRSVRYDVRGFGEALDSIEDPCAWK